MNTSEIIEKSQIVYRACQRIDIGGTTDLREVTPLLEEGGACFNIGITLYAFACYQPADSGLHLHSLDLDAEETIQQPSSLTMKNIKDDDSLKLLKALLIKMGYKGQGRITTFSEPRLAGTGLGTSAAMGIAYTGLLNDLAGLNKDRDELVKICFDTETLPKERGGLGITGGSQDQYAAAYGGFNLWRFFPDKTERLTIQRENIDEEYLLKRILLCYCGKSHYSGDSNALMMKNIVGKEPKTIEAIYRVRDIAKEMHECFEKKEYEKIPELLNEETRYRKNLHPIAINGPAPDYEYRKFMETGLQAGARAAKAMGAGGGGTWEFWVEPEKREPVTALLEKQGGQILDFKFDFDGLIKIK